MGQRAAPAPFLTKTYQLVDDRVTDEVVSWNESGTAFVVWKTADFAKDLLPNYFKHNNFSSFVRQLNTYGFRKIVPDKWEFANDNFKRGEKELLSHIRRRKTALPSHLAGKSNAVACDQQSPSNSGEDLGSTSTSSPDSKRGGWSEAPSRAPFPDLSDENEKLKRDNAMLITELSQTKKQCDELMTLLKKCINAGPNQMDCMRQASCGSIHDGSESKVESMENTNNDDDENKNDNDNGLKLFGVWVKGNGKKRGREENFERVGVQMKERKTSEIDVPWMKITSLRGETSKVCN